MSSPWRTGLKSEALEALPEVVELARDTLPPEKLEETYEVAKGKARRSSLGVNVKILRKTKSVPSDLVERLQRYNDFLYTPGKHDFSLPPGRKHRFTSKEVVLSAYISIDLAERIKSLSKLAREAVEKDNLYMMVVMGKFEESCVCWRDRKIMGYKSLRKSSYMFLR